MMSRTKLPVERGGQGMISMADVARKARVSQTTASLVLNNKHQEFRISETTCKRVLAVARDMGYQRNELARSVASGKNFVLGFGMRDRAAEQDLHILEGVLVTASAAGYLLNILPYDSYERPDELVKLCVQQRLAGTVMSPFHRSDDTITFINKLSHYRIPVVFMSTEDAVFAATRVGSDDDLGYREAIKHLIDLCHSRIGFLTGCGECAQSLRARHRFLRIMREHGLTAPESFIVDTENNPAMAELQIIDMFTARDLTPTALFCADDAVAAVAMRALSQVGLRVPEDVSVVGYGDFGFARLLNPPLTTISLHFAGTGRVAALVLLDILSGNIANGSTMALTVAPSLVIRESTDFQNILQKYTA